jgi:PAS domain S-box-containing protein
VVASLLCLAIIPFSVQSRTRASWNELVNVADSARALATEIQLGLTLETGDARAYLLAAESREASDHSRVRARRHRAEAELLPLARQLGASVLDPTLELRAQLVPIDALRDSLYGGLIARPAYAARILNHPERLRVAVETAGRVDAAIGHAAHQIRLRIQGIERASRIIDAALVVVAFLAWAVVARVGRQQRALAIRLDRRERWQAAFGEAARRLNASATAPEVEQTLREVRGERGANGDASYVRALDDLATAALQRVRLLEALRDSEERFRQIAENIREFIWLANPDFSKHYYVNAAYSEIWGRSTASLYEDPWSLLEGVHPDDRARVEAALAGMRRGVYDIEFRVVRPDGDVRWVWSRGFPVTNEHGEIYRVAGITEDITERKRVAENRARLVRGFTHDVKNPLGAADGFLALLEDDVMGELPDDQRDAVARARGSIHRALELIQNVLELARAEAGQFEIRRRTMNPAAVARDIAEEFRAQAHAKGLSLEFEEREDVPPIESDASRVRQIVANLVSNAVKYTPAGGHIAVAARTRSDGRASELRDWIEIEVTDDGPGIPADKQRTLFEEFTRFDPQAAQGAGIGLAISRRIATALGGTISVQSQEGAGSTFTLMLPLEPAVEANAPSA